MYQIYFAHRMNIFNVHTTRKINSIHAIFYHMLSLSLRSVIKILRSVKCAEDKVLTFPYTPLKMLK